MARGVVCTVSVGVLLDLRERRQRLRMQVECVRGLDCGERGANDLFGLGRAAVTGEQWPLDRRPVHLVLELSRSRLRLDGVDELGSLRVALLSLERLGEPEPVCALPAADA